MRGFLIDDMRAHTFLRKYLLAKNEREKAYFPIWSDWINKKTGYWTQGEADNRTYLCSWNMVNIYDPIKYVKLK